MPSEFDLIRQFAASLGTPRRAREGIGDDAAVLDAGGGNLWLFAADMLIEGVHFDRTVSSLADVGWKALAVNVSDIAAMGGIARYATVAVGLPSPADAEPLFRGLRECAEAHAVEIVGGDTVRSPGPLVIDVAILGQSEGIEPVRRRGARAGDLVCVTGWLGAAAAGLEAAKRAQAGEGPVPEELLAAHRRPSPRAREGRLLAQLGASAMIDISDGLASDARHVAEASHVAIVIEPERIPLHPAAVAAARRWQGDPFSLALFGGEDFELLACVAPERLSAVKGAVEGLGLPLTVIGRCEAGGGVWLESNGQRRALSPGGWDHFR